MLVDTAPINRPEVISVFCGTPASAPAATVAFYSPIGQPREREVPWQA